MKIPKPIQDVINGFERLPGIGPKTAQRLGYYLLHVPQQQLDDFGLAVAELRKKTKLCRKCFQVCEQDLCDICLDESRDQQTICVVEQPLDVIAVEKGGFYKGLYHVLHGVISPLDNIGPDQLHISEILSRLGGRASVAEVVIATNPTMEGEATALYIQKKVSEKFSEVAVSRLGRGLPTGADIEYADEVTLTRAFEGRNKL